MQKSFIQYGGFQCGICTPGQVVAAKALLDENPRPNEDEIKDWMMGNLCRCTGYYKIIESIQKAHQFVSKDTAMIPFEYRTPKSLKEVHATLKEFGSDAKLIAGGTSLVIMMRQRLVRPNCLVSLRSVRGLNSIEIHDGGIRIGGLATHREVESSSLLRRRLPLLAETYHHVATIRVRNMATVGGGLAHADPNQDPPPTLIALGATVKATSADGSRVIPLDEFFTDYYETVLKPDEIVTEVFIPKMAPNSAGAYLKFLPRTADDYATVSAAAVLTLDKTRKTDQRRTHCSRQRRCDSDQGHRG